jgi:serine/threonine-protein kinase
MKTVQTDHNLLFGLLAFQNGLIDQDQLLGAFRAWTLDKGVSLAGHLVERGHLDEAERVGVDVIVALQLKKHGSSVEKSLAAIPAAPSTCHSLASLGDAEIEASLGHAGLAFGRRTLPDKSGAEVTATCSVGAATSDGQRFQVLRPYARGGLGAVFVALDNELHREVALKQILDHHADDPVSRDRFVREAEVTGGLEHPGIVPVYGLGSYSDGRPFYAMRFIRGESLKQAIERFHGEPGRSSAGSGQTGEPGRVSAGSRSENTQGRGSSPLAFRQLLRRFVDVCNALEYAHSRGVIHRDIKPANIVLGKHGETLLVDWGLAKARGEAEPGSTAEERALVPSSSSGSSETLPGSALGTPAYMSPEQARGDLDALGPHSDVYSLGATLYCLLTGKPPLEGDDIGALLQAVERGEIPAPRTLDHTIDPALEAICQKAMALKPSDRYNAPKALADEIERWMADEPVTAWHEPVMRRMLRWLARHRVGVTAAAAAGLVALVGLATVLAVQSRANRALGVKNDALLASNVRERQRFELAMEAIKLFHGEVSEDMLLKEKQFETLRTKLLRGAAEFYKKLQAQLESDRNPRSGVAMVEALAGLAKVTEDVGSAEDALKLYERVAALGESFISANPSNVRSYLTVVDAETWAAILLQETGRREEALHSAEKAHRVAERLLVARPEVPDAQMALGRALIQLGSANQQFDRDAALKFHRQAVDVLEGLVAANPNVPEYRYMLSRAHGDLGNTHYARNEMDRSIEQNDVAARILEDLSKSVPAEPRYRRNWAQALNAKAMAMQRMGHYRDAIPIDRQSVNILDSLVSAYPAVVFLQHLLASALTDLGVAQWHAGVPTPDVIKTGQRELAVREHLLSLHPDRPDLHLFLGNTLTNFGWYYERSGRLSDALAASERARDVLERSVKAFPKEASHRKYLASACRRIGALLYSMGRASESLAARKQALALCEPLVSAGPADIAVETELAQIHYEIGAHLADVGRAGEALAHHEKARKIRQRLADATPKLVGLQSDLAWSLTAIGNLYLESAKPTEAQVAHEQARTIAQALADAAPSAPGYRRQLAMSFNNIGDSLAKLNRPEDSIAAFERARGIHEALVKTYPDVDDYKSGLSFSLTGIARIYAGVGRAPEAVAATRRAIALRDAIPAATVETRFDLVRNHALLARLSGNPRLGLSATEGSVEADRAIAALRGAVAAGYRKLRQAQSDPDLEPVRSRSDFQMLVLDIAFPIHPFCSLP